MRQFLKEHPAWFERYALRDTEVTLKIFVTLQEALNQLAYGETRQLFKTLAAAAVKGFLEENKWFKRYRRQLQDERFESAYRLIMRSYHGGRNEGLMVGDSREF
jgi:DNA-binding SARP family transcriptional activator